MGLQKEMRSVLENISLLHAFESQSGRCVTAAHKHAADLLEGGLDAPTLLNAGMAVQLALASGM